MRAVAVKDLRISRFHTSDMTIFRSLEKKLLFGVSNHMWQLQDVHSFQGVKLLYWNMTFYFQIYLMQLIVLSVLFVSMLIQNVQLPAFMNPRLPHKQQYSQTDPRRIQQSSVQTQICGTEDPVEADFLHLYNAAFMLSPPLLLEKMLTLSQRLNSCTIRDAV